MKRIKTQDIDPDKLITKAALARRESCSQTEINRKIEAGKYMVVVTSDKKELVHL